MKPGRIPAWVCEDCGALFFIPNQMTDDGKRAMCKDCGCDRTKRVFTNAQQEEQKGDPRVQLFLKVIPLLEKLKKSKESTSTEKCPICGNDLHMWKAAYNGHVRMQCETPNCLSAME